MAQDGLCTQHRQIEEHPLCVLHNGHVHWRTGKTGRRFDDGEACAEYACHLPGLELRAWRGVSGRIWTD